MLGTVLETNLFIHLSLLSTTKLKTTNSCGGTCKDIASRSLIFAGAASISAFLPNLDTTGHECNVAENINNFHEFHGYNNSITNSNEFYGYNSEEWS